MNRQPLPASVVLTLSTFVVTATAIPFAANAAEMCYQDDIGRIVKRLGEQRALLFGCAMGALGFTLYGLAPNGWWFWAAMPIAALWAVSMPAAQAIMTQHVAPHEQGRLQGAIGSLNSIAGILGPTLFTQTLAAVAVAHVHDFWAGATFWLAAGFVGLGGLIAWRATRSKAPTPA